MKKIILSLFVLFILSSNVSFAQISVGIKGGVNSMWLSPRPGNENSETRIGLALGGFVRFKLPIIGLYIQPELMFSQKGGKVTAGNNTSIAKINNLEIPVLIGKSFFAGLFRFYLGPQFNLVLSGKFENTQTIGGATITTSGDLQNYNNLYLGGQVGIGFDIKKLVLDLNWQPSLGNFYKDNGNYKPQAIQLTVGYKFM